MATTISSVFLKFLLSASLLSLCLLCSLKNGYAFEERKTTETQHDLYHHAHTIQLTSLLSSPVCNPSAKAAERKSTLKVVHKYGPCFQHNRETANYPSHTEILLQDQSRVNWIQSKFSKNSDHSDIKEKDAATLPAKDGRVVSTGNYIVTVGLGTPEKYLSLVFDTGSDLTWTQCEPCVGYCYQQKEPKYDPSVSTTYANVSCSSTVCDSLESATGHSQDCASSTCVYGIQYGDSSFSVGFFGQESLTLTPSDIFPGFYFGCGQNNRGLFGTSAGLLGLGRHPISIVSQTAQKYNRFFSYCLPSSSSSTGHLTFGNADGLSNSVKFTPLSATSKIKSLYGVDITGISVGGNELPISQSVFSTAGAIIDSGTVITRLPPDAYSSLRSAFRQLMAKYPMAPPFSILDTCYDLSGYDTIDVPKISFFFSGGVEVSLHGTGILYGVSPSQVCLAFAGNADPNTAAIFGNVQQRTLEVVYDDAAGGGRVGFAPGGCA